MPPAPPVHKHERCLNPCPGAKPRIIARAASPGAFVGFALRRKLLTLSLRRGGVYPARFGRSLTQLPAEKYPDRPDTRRSTLVPERIEPGGLSTLPAPKGKIAMLFEARCRAPPRTSSFEMKCTSITPCPQRPEPPPAASFFCARQVSCGSIEKSTGRLEIIWL